MGVVYKAQDVNLDRFVALKFLPAHISQSEEEKSRFIQEAKSASALNHPNVCTIYGIDEFNGQQFIEMELVDGGTLRDKVISGNASKTSSLSIKQVVEYAIQISEALQEAHGKGIIHRDIKAENIMVNSKNQIKVMDFGLAKLKGSLKLTRTSSTIGTLAYMSPEQIQGKEADVRSDIFSFGVVLFEMITGNTPFRGEHEAAIMYSILNEEPDDVSHYRDEVPAELVHIVNKTLEKDPEDRYQSMSEIIVDLRRLKRESTRVVRTPAPQQPGSGRSQATPPVPEKSSGKSVSRKSIAGIGIAAVVLISLVFFKDAILSKFASKSNKTIVVIPFENLGPNDKDYFVDGMTDEVTSRLSGLSGLHVIAPSSANQYRKTAKSFRQIGDELGVSYVLQGTVRWEVLNGETHVRVNPSLIKVEDGTQAWSQSMESVLSSAFKMQSDIASRVASALDIALLKTEKQTLETSLTNSADSYDYYLQAIQYANRSLARTDFEIAIQLLERAIRIDPSFAAAYAKLAQIHANMYWFFYDRSESRAASSRFAAEKAIELSPRLSESYEAMGWYYYHAKLDYANALDQFSLALKYGPGNSSVHYGIAAVLRRQGKMHESAESYRKAIVGDPRSAELIRELGETLTLTRDYGEAGQNYDKALQLSPDVALAYWGKMKNLLLWKGDIKEVREIAEQGFLRIGNGDKRAILLMSYLLDLMEGDFLGAEQRITKLSSEEGVNTQFQYYPSSLLLAQVEALRGNRSKARLYFDSARVQLEHHQKTNPEDERTYSSLGITYAGLGRNEDAIRSGLRGVEMLPVEREAWRGSFRLIDLAQVYAMTGDQEKAIDVLERLLSIPSELSNVWLKIDPAWNPLRTNKRFQQLVAGVP